MLKWFSRHPEVTRVFAAQLSGGAGIRTTPARQVRRRGRGLPEGVEDAARHGQADHVIRDTPKMRGDTDTCVQQAIVGPPARRDGLRAAAQRPRWTATRPSSAAQQRTRRASRYVDLTRYFCDSRTCFPVIGGALVYKDATHITSVYGRTLGPYLLRALG